MEADQTIAETIIAAGGDPAAAAMLQRLSRTAPLPVPLVPGLPGQDAVQADFAAWHGPRLDTAPESFVHRSPYQLLHANALLTKGTPLPDGIDRGTPKHCYWNALDLARSSNGTWIYAEGLAQGAFWSMSHAWCVLADDPAVIADPTWDEPENAWYLGIAFDTAWLAGRDVPLIDNWSSDWPLLRTGLPDGAVHVFPDARRADPPGARTATAGDTET